MPIWHNHDMKMNWNDLVKSRMKDIGMTQAGLAEKMGVAQGSIARYLGKVREPSIETIASMMRCVGLTYMTLKSDGTIESDEYRSLEKNTKLPYEHPILGLVSSYHLQSPEKINSKDLLATTEMCSDSSYWLIVDGHSMTAHQGSGISFPEGMLILIDPNREYTNGNFVVAYCNEKQQTTFKKISIEPEGTFLVPLNPDPIYKRINISDEFCQIVGVAVDARWRLI